MPSYLWDVELLALSCRAILKSHINRSVHERCCAWVMPLLYSLLSSLLYSAAAILATAAVPKWLGPLVQIQLCWQKDYFLSPTFYQQGCIHTGGLADIVISAIRCKFFTHIVTIAEYIILTVLGSAPNTSTTMVPSLAEKVCGNHLHALTLDFSLM